MSRDINPQLEDAARHQLTRLIDSIDTGPAPSWEDGLELGESQHVEVIELKRADPGQVRPVPGRWTVVAAVAVAAAVALVLGAVIVLRSRENGNDVSTNPDEVPRLVPDASQLPAGLQPVGASELPLRADEVDPGTATVTVYGDPSADDPFADADLAVVVVEDETIGMGGEETTIRGHDGRTGESTEANDVGIAQAPDGVAWVSWEESPDVEVTLLSRTFDVDTLVGLVGEPGFEVDGTSVTLGWVASGTVGSELGAMTLPFGGVPSVPRSAVGHAAYYAAGSAPMETALFVTTFIGTPQELVVLRWMIGDGEPVDVRGEAGWFSHPPGSPGLSSSQILVWPESENVIGVVQGGGFSEDELFQAVETLHEASDEEWTDLVRGG